MEEKISLKNQSADQVPFSPEGNNGYDLLHTMSGRTSRPLTRRYYFIPRLENLNSTPSVELKEHSLIYPLVFRNLEFVLGPFLNLPHISR